MSASNSLKREEVGLLTYLIEKAAGIWAGEKNGATCVGIWQAQGSLLGQGKNALMGYFLTTHVLC